MSSQALLIREPDIDEKIESMHTFSIRTGVMKAASGDDGDPVVRVTASSDSIDLEGDRFTEKALQEMQAGFVGLTIFLNHKYDIPECVFGTVTKAEIVKRDGFQDLDLEIRVCQESERGMQAYKMIQAGVKLGVSVGVMVDDVEKTDEKHRGRPVIEINSTIPLEASVVGIPANRRSWVQDAILGLVERGVVDPDVAFVGDRPWLAKALKGRRRLVEDTDMSKTKKKSAEEQELADKASVPQSKGTLKDTSSWDGDGADSRLRKWASSDGSGDKDTIDWDKYEKGFATFDPDNKEGFTGYGFPHHDIIDSEFVASSAGVHAAGNAASGGMTGKANTDAQKHLEAHYEQMGVDAPWKKSEEEGATDDADPDEHKDTKSCCGNPGAPECCENADGSAKDSAGDTGSANPDKGVEPEEQKKVLPILQLDAFTEELAEQEFWTNFYNAWYAIYSCLWEILCDDDADAAAKTAAADAALTSFHQFVLSAVTAAATAGVDDDDSAAEQKEAAEKAIKSMFSILQKRGARNSSTDAEAIQSVHGLSVDLGATCSDAGGAGDDGDESKDASAEYTAMKTSLAETATKLAEYAEKQGKQAEELAEKDEVLGTQKDIIEQLLSLPFARKAVIDVDGEKVNAVEVAKRFPFYDPSITRRLAANAEKK